MSERKRIDEDETVVAALREGRHADDIYLMDCPYCGEVSYWNQGSHFTCRACGSHKGTNSEEAYTLADYWETATYPCDEQKWFCPVCGSTTHQHCSRGCASCDDPKYAHRRPAPSSGREDVKFSINRIQLPWAFFRWWGGYQGRGSNRPSRNLGLGATMKPGDEILIRAKLINVRERDNEATVGFDSTTTVVVPLGAVGQLDSSGLHKLWRISQAVKLHSDPAQLQQFYDYVKGVVGKPEVK